ncbi:hypothetical protein RISK_002760 [Rhodopirellula islandica]|uniref:Uncharacterized protein n=1 Tax=Rhodopirellula islandica TaxID=595434 RepID=A0A0J1EIC1_RHOIS|nr:hypothetical protein RISK_002760 [Rhodopirellula islandica]
MQSLVIASTFLATACHLTPFPNASERSILRNGPEITAK